MRKIIAAINMTVDGFCDHTTMKPDDELHQHYNDLLRNAGDILYGRITYQLMESSWPAILKNPSGDKVANEFAGIIEDIPKIVFSHTLKNVEWKNARLAKRELKEEVLELKQQQDNDILVGSRSLIVTLLNLNLVDEFQLCIHPIIAGKGLSLLKNINERIDLKLLKTKTFVSSGAVIFYYEPIKNEALAFK